MYSPLVFMRILVDLDRIESPKASTDHSAVERNQEEDNST
jgi:hypothetical protein